MSAGKASGVVTSAARDYFQGLTHLPSRLKRRAFKTETYEEMRISAHVASENPMKRVGHLRAIAGLLATMTTDIAGSATNP